MCNLTPGSYYCRFCFDSNKIAKLNLVYGEHLELCEEHKSKRGNFYFLYYNGEEWIQKRGNDILTKEERDEWNEKHKNDCSICHTPNKTRDQNHRGKDGKENGGCDCSKEWYTQHNQSPEMREKSRQSMLKLLADPTIQYPCKKCGNKDRYYPMETCNKCGYNPHSEIYSCQNCQANIASPFATCHSCGFLLEKEFHCIKCDSVLKNSFQTCPSCGFNRMLESGIAKLPRQYSLISDENMRIVEGSIPVSERFYKGKKVKEIIVGIESGELNIEDYPDIDKRFGHWCYNKYSVIAGNRILVGGMSFQEYDDKLFYHNIDWEEYKKNFKQLDNYHDEIIDKYGFVMEPTFRTQDSMSWGESSGAFERYLLDKGYTHIVYIKYYIDRDGNIKPIVCGITGSYNVNLSGTDIDFGYYDAGRSEYATPARKFLSDEGFAWYKEHVAILNVNTRKEAEELEMYLQNEYKLFGS